MDAQMTDTATEPARTSAPAATHWYDRLAAIARDNPFLFVLVALVAVVMALLSPALLVGDSWMTLVAGRVNYNFNKKMFFIALLQ